MFDITEQRGTDTFDVLVIGAGPGGLAAATAARQKGARRVAVLERDDAPGGILNQCIHDGFGIVRYGAQLSGPEYAEMEADLAADAGVQLLTGCMVTEIAPLGSAAGERIAPMEPVGEQKNTPNTEADATLTKKGVSLQPTGADDVQVCKETRTPPAGARPAFAVTAIRRSGRLTLRAKAVVLATGCRERTRGMLSIPGTRPAGVYTAGVAQNLINRRNLMVGRRVVILGSGDIGLIMARRLTLEGAQVLCAAEVMDTPSGLARNVQQCLFDYGIPLHLRTTVSNVYGKKRLEGVELSQVDAGLQPIPGSQRRIDCDTLILSVGLIPENEVAKTAGVSLDPRTGGARTDDHLQTDVPGIFACGNARAVMDLADFVSQQGEIAGRNAACHALGQPLEEWALDPHNATRKGMPEAGSVTCTLCPKGCQVRVRRTPTEEALQFTGNGCPRGEAFARQELTDPHRILTTTVKVRVGAQRTAPKEAEQSGSEAVPGGAMGATRRSGDPREFLLPVRSDRPVPLHEMKALADQLRTICLDLPPDGIRRGDIIAEHLGSEGANLIAERSVPAIAE